MEFDWLNRTTCMDTNLPVEPTIRAIKANEERAFWAWPAEECENTGGWILRHTAKAKVRRGNSVCPNRIENANETDDLIAIAEAFYNARDLPSRFQMSPAAEPTDLDDRLEARGYEVEAPVLVQWASCTAVVDAAPSAHDTHTSNTLYPGWHAVHADSSKDDDDLMGRNRIIDRITSPLALVSAEDQGQPAAIGLGVQKDDWCGIFCMHTLATYRRQCLADRVLAGVSRWALQQGVKFLYLQVEEDNPVARTFYESRGFTTAYGYHYRTRFKQGLIDE